MMPCESHAPHIYRSVQDATVALSSQTNCKACTYRTLLPCATIHHVSSAEDKQELSMIVSPRRTSVYMVLHMRSPLSRWKINKAWAQRWLVNATECNLELRKEQGRSRQRGQKPCLNNSHACDKLSEETQRGKTLHFFEDSNGFVSLKNVFGTTLCSRQAGKKIPPSFNFVTLAIPISELMVKGQTTRSQDCWNTFIREVNHHEKTFPRGRRTDKHAKTDQNDLKAI